MPCGDETDGQGGGELAGKNPGPGVELLLHAFVLASSRLVGFARDSPASAEHAVGSTLPFRVF